MLDDVTIHIYSRSSVKTSYELQVNNFSFYKQHQLSYFPIWGSAYITMGLINSSIYLRIRTIASTDKVTAR